MQLPVKLIEWLKRLMQRRPAFIINPKPRRDFVDVTPVTEPVQQVMRSPRLSAHTFGYLLWLKWSIRCFYEVKYSFLILWQLFRMAKLQMQFAILRLRNRQLLRKVVNLQEKQDSLLLEQRALLLKRSIPHRQQIKHVLGVRDSACGANQVLCSVKHTHEN